MASPRQPASTVGAFAFLRRFGFSSLQLRLTKLCGLRGIGSRPQGGLLEEVAPALVPIRWILVAFELLQGRLSVGSPFDHLDHSRRLVSADVVAYDNVGSLQFVVRKNSPFETKDPTLRLCAEAVIGKLIEGRGFPQRHPLLHDARHDCPPESLAPVRIHNGRPPMQVSLARPTTGIHEHVLRLTIHDDHVGA
jgi:hypothetical protein